MRINGSMYMDMMVSAANNLENRKEAINNLNVFPVPDGDTGVNMSMTMSPIRNEGVSLSGEIGACSKAAASMMLRSARGNSGVILSLFFRGVSKVLENSDSADCDMLRRAFSKGVGEAYKAIQNPTEGTILTVMREAAEACDGDCADNPSDLFDKMAKAAEITLAKTPEMLPVLKQAGVVDAGGAGFVAILSGMRSALAGNPVKLNNSVIADAKAEFSEFSSEDIEYPYCTECIVDKGTDYIGEDMAYAFKDFVMSAGNSAVFVDDEEIIKVHVHTKDPGAVISEAVKYGALRTVKIENMRIQHSQLTVQTVEASTENAEKKVGTDKKYGFVSVTMGVGIKETFIGLGADSFVYGGQTMNPSTDQILEAIGKSTGETVYILPNNSNICLVAKQAAELCDFRHAVVIPSTSVAQGLAAMLAFNCDETEDENTAAMISALSGVASLEMTYAAHDSVFDGQKITEGQLLGLVEHKVKYIANDRRESMGQLLENMKGASYVTVFYGEDVGENEAEEMRVYLTGELGDETEVSFINGGQPLYYYLISVE